MPRGDKSSYTDKQKRQAEHIEKSYEDKGVPEPEAQSRAWATVNKISGGGRKSGAGRGAKEITEPSERGRKGGAAAVSRSAAQRSASARKAAQARAHNRGQGKA